MGQLSSHFFSKPDVGSLHDLLLERSESSVYNYEKHQFEYVQEGHDITLRLPIHLHVNEGQLDLDYRVKYLMLLVQTSSASVGVFEDEECLEHKVFTAYMVRKKQGKSQIKHLKTKGKSRAGSRIRLASGIEFFEDINTRLTRHFSENEFDRIAFSCSKILLPFLFGSKVPTPFDRKDERIYKIPKHLHQPTFEVMLGMQRFLNKAELIFDEKTLPDLGEIKSHL